MTQKSFGDVFTYELLYDLYNIQGKTIGEISKIYGCYKDTVRSWIRKRKICKHIQKHNKKVINKIKSDYGCCVCNEREPVVLDFHHIDKETKSFTIGDGLRHYKLYQLFNEIEKCVVVCANCHSKLNCGVINVNNNSVIQIDKIQIIQFMGNNYGNK